MLSRMEKFIRSSSAATVLAAAMLLSAVIFGCAKERDPRFASPIEGCVVKTRVSPVEFYSDADANGLVRRELPVFTELTVVGQSGDFLDVRFEDGGGRAEGWVPLGEVSLTKEALERLVGPALGGDEKAAALMRCGFFMYGPAEAVERLAPILAEHGARLRNPGWREDAVARRLVELVLPKFHRVVGLEHAGTNPLHLVVPYADGEILRGFDDRMDCPDSEGRSCLMLAVESGNVEAARHFHEILKGRDFDGLDRKDNAGRTLADYVHGSGSAEIRSLLADCLLDIGTLAGRCAESLSLTQAERDGALEGLPGDVRMLTQRAFREGAEAVVVRGAEMLLPDGTGTRLDPLDTVEIVRLLGGGDGRRNRLFEYEIPVGGARRPCRFNFYLVRRGEKFGILGGSALAHEELRAGQNMGVPARPDSVRLFVAYKYEDEIGGQGAWHYADLFERDEGTGDVRRLETGSLRDGEFEGAPVFIGGQESMCNFSLARFYRFEMGGERPYFCALAFNPFPGSDRTLHAFYAVRGDGRAFHCGSSGNSEYVKSCADVRSSFVSEPDAETGLPGLTVFEYGHELVAPETGEMSDPFCVTISSRLDPENMRFEETGAEFSDVLPEF